MAAGRCFFGSQYYGGVEFQVAESAEGAESQTCLASRCRTDVFDDCAAPRLFVDIVKLPLKPFLLPVRHACCVVRCPREHLQRV